MNFSARLVLGTFAVVVCTIAVLLWGTERALRDDLEQSTEARLSRDAQAAVASLSPEMVMWPADVRRLSVQTGHRVVLRLGDSVIGASDSIRGARFLVAQAGRGHAMLELHASVTPIEEAVRRARNSMLASATVALLISLGLAAIAGRSIGAPLLAISRNARAIAAGATPRFPHSQIPEIDVVVSALREMHAQLATRFTALEREKAESAAIVESMVEGIIATDRSGRIVTINGAARALLGYDEAAPLPNLATLFRTKEAREAVDEVLAGEAVIDREMRIGDSVLTINARPLPGGGAVLVLHDLTGIRKLESVRRDFVANVSHELKTPLTSIAGYAETLTDPEVDPETRQRFIGTILSNSRRMQHLVDDLLDLSRIESGVWKPQPIPADTETLAAEAWADVADRANARRIRFTLAVAPDARVVHADPDSLGHVLGNLLDNAVRHVPDGGSVAISAARAPDGVMIAVTDNGSGIAPEHLPRLFERFYRVDPSRSREQGGTGLGLAIVKHLVEAHGGRVSIASTPRQGTAVTVTFPDP